MAAATQTEKCRITNSFATLMNAINISHLPASQKAGYLRILCNIYCVYGTRRTSGQYDPEVLQQFANLRRIVQRNASRIDEPQAVAAADDKEPEFDAAPANVRGAVVSKRTVEDAGEDALRKSATRAATLMQQMMDGD